LTTKKYQDQLEKLNGFKNKTEELEELEKIGWILRSKVIGN